MDNIEETLTTLKETLVFLVEQEKVRADEISALNEKIEAVNDTLVNQIINPAIEKYKEDQYNGFRDKYGDRLGKYDDLMRSSLNEPEYDSTREAWEDMESMPEEEKKDFDVDAYVDKVESGLAEYVETIKAKLNLPEDAAMEIKTDGENIEVKTDTNGDGKAETTVAEEKEEVKEEEPKEEPAEEEKESEGLEIDPELEKELQAFAGK